METGSSLTTYGVRRLLDKTLPSIEDLRAFLLDALGPKTYQNFEGISNRTQLVTQVLHSHADNLEQIVDVLRRRYPARFKRYQHLLDVECPTSDSLIEAMRPGIWARSLARRGRLGIVLAAMLLSIADLLIVILRPGTTASPPEEPPLRIGGIVFRSTSDIGARQNIPPSSPKEFDVRLRQHKDGDVEVLFSVDRETMVKLLAEILRTREQVAATQLNQSAVDELRRDPSPEAKRVVMYFDGILSRSGRGPTAGNDAGPTLVDLSGPRDIDMGRIVFDLGTSGPIISQGGASAPSPPEPSQPPKPLPGVPGQVPTASDLLEQAWQLYVEGHYLMAIRRAEIAKRQPHLPNHKWLSAWRLIGEAGCYLRRLTDVNDAYAYLDNDGRRAIALKCADRGLVLTGKRFRRPKR